MMTVTLKPHHWRMDSTARSVFPSNTLLSSIKILFWSPHQHSGSTTAAAKGEIKKGRPEAIKGRRFGRHLDLRSDAQFLTLGKNPNPYLKTRGERGRRVGLRGRRRRRRGRGTQLSREFVLHVLCAASMGDDAVILCLLRPCLSTNTFPHPLPHDSGPTCFVTKVSERPT